MSSMSQRRASRTVAGTVTTEPEVSEARQLQRGYAHAVRALFVRIPAVG